MIVRFFAYIRDYTHVKDIDIEKCSTVEELFYKLCSMYGKSFEGKVFKDGKLSDEIIILVNGRHIKHCSGVQTRLGQDDEISVFPVVAGG